MSDNQLGNVKVSNYNLIEFRKLLETETREKLKEYFDKYIIQEEKQRNNDLKKMLYTLMKRYQSTDEDTSRKYYCLYQNFKNGKVDYDTTMEKLMTI